MSEYFVRDNLYHEYDSRSPSSRAAERQAIEDKVNSFLRNGGSIKQISQPTIGEIKAKFNASNVSIPEKSLINAQKHKQHHVLNWEIALDAGRETFIGQVCKKCGGSERYVKGHRSCIVCFPARGVHGKTKAMHARKAARQADEPTYIGQPCCVCGCTTRSTETGACDKYYSHTAIKRAQRAESKAARLAEMRA